MMKILFALAFAISLVLPERSAAQVRAASDPGLQPGDLVEITVWQREELSGEFTVAQDGTLVHPLYRQVRVTGLPADQVEDRLRSFLSQFEANPQVSVRPLYQVAVAGQVFRPDIYTVQPGTTITQVVTMAGGVLETADTEEVQLTRGTTTREVDLRQLATVQMPVQSGDQLLVKAEGSVSVVRERILPLVQLGLTIANIAFLSTRD